MKGILTLVFCGLILSSYSFANTSDLDRGSAAVDDKYQDEIKTRESAIERQPQNNYLNSPMYHQESSQDRGAMKAMDKQEQQELENKKGQD